MYNVLIIDKDPMARKLMEIFISSSKKYNLLPSQNSLAEQEYRMAIADLLLVDMITALDSAGLNPLQQQKARFPRSKLILITDSPEYHFPDCARQVGADSFWYKKPEAEALLGIMDRTMAGESVYPDGTPVQKLGKANSAELTARELEVLTELVDGKTDAAIAQTLALSVATIKFHIQKIREKTGFSTRTELAVRARESGLVIGKYDEWGV